MPDKSFGACKVEWPDEAPDALLNGVNIDRNLLIPVPPMETKDPCGNSDQETWRIGYLATPEGSQMQQGIVFIGDYCQTSGRLHAAVSVSALVALRNDALIEARQDLARAAHTYAPWASHVLWDTLRLRMIALLGSDAVPPEVPVLTPEFSLYVLSEIAEDKQENR